MIGLQFAENLHVEDIARQHEVHDLPAAILNTLVADRPAGLDDIEGVQPCAGLDDIAAGRKGLQGG